MMDTGYVFYHFSPCFKHHTNTSQRRKSMEPQTPRKFSDHLNNGYSYMPPSTPRMKPATLASPRTVQPAASLVHIPVTPLPSKTGALNRIAFGVAQTCPPKRTSIPTPIPQLELDNNPFLAANLKKLLKPLMKTKPYSASPLKTAKVIDGDEYRRTGL